MAYNITLTNGNAYATVNDGTIVTNTSTITLVGKNYAGYGAVLDENFVHLMENSASTTAPTGAVVGQLWYNSATNQMQVYNGTVFRSLSAVTSSNAAPSLTAGYNANSGDLWYDTVNAQLNVYTGNSWLVTGPAFTSSQGTSGAIVATVQDNFLQSHTVVELYSGGNIIGMFSQDTAFTPSPVIPGFPTVYPGLTMANVVNGNVVPGITLAGNIVAGNISGNFTGNIGGNTANITANNVTVVGNAQILSLGVGTAASGVTGEIRATNGVTAYYSDDRLKTRLGTIDGALDKVCSLDGFYYQANDVAVDLGYTVKREVGLSAQQVQAVLPEVVVPAPIDEKYLTIHYERLVPLLVESIKELRREIASLRDSR